MIEFIWSVAFIIGGFVLTIQLAGWLWTAPGEFIRLLKQGPSPKLAFVFIGIGLTLASLIVVHLSNESLNEPGAYLVALAGSIGFTALLYQLFLKTKYQTAGYFFLVLLKVFLVIIPTVILVIAQNYIGACSYFFIMLLITYYSAYWGNTKVKRSAPSMQGIETKGRKFSKVFLYIAGALFNAALGYFISLLLSKYFQ